MALQLSAERLRALSAAWPLISSDSFRLRILELRRGPHGTLNASTQELAFSLDRKMREQASSLSLEAQGQLRDQVWFTSRLHGSEEFVDQLDMVDYLLRTATDYLADHGSYVGLRDGIEMPQHGLEWRWLISYLPVDLLIAALNASQTSPQQPVTDHVTLVTPPLQKLLAVPEQVTESHLHLGAAHTFTQLWAGLMQRKYLLALKLKGNERSEMPFGSGERFKQRLLQAAVIRMLLADYLLNRLTSRTVANMELFITAQKKLYWEGQSDERGYRRCLRDLVSSFGPGQGEPGLQSDAELSRLYSRGFGRFEHRQERQAASHANRSQKLPPLQALYAGDPIALWLAPSASLAAPETRLAYHALHHMNTQGRADRLFASMFWQYQRVRCALYGFLVQEPGICGFDWFRRFYSRISQFAKALDPSEATLALVTESQDVRLAAFEGRKAPLDRTDKVFRTVRNFIRQSIEFQSEPPAQLPEVGLVFHFVKDSEDAIAKSLGISTTQLSALGYERRHHYWFASRARQARAVHGLLRRHPESLLVLRGLDVANRELTVGTWLTARLLIPLRSASQRCARLVHARHPDWNVTPLRLCYHAGEEYRRLSEGLRRIHELIETNLLQHGDRVGHGLALGISPRRWADGATQITQPCDERLDDLLWELDRYAQSSVPCTAGRLAQVRDEAWQLGRMIYGQQDFDVSIELLREARRLRHRLDEIANQGYALFPGERNGVANRDSSQTSHDRARRLLRLYLYDTGVFERGQKPTVVKTLDSEIEFLNAAQNWLRGELAKLDVTIESNPSSNLLISDYSTLEEHPAFQMQPLQEGHNNQLPLSVSDDNPVTFATCVADEYAHLYFALLRQNVSAHHALAWLRQRREDGWQSRFSLPKSRDQLTRLFHLLAPIEAARMDASSRRR